MLHSNNLTGDKLDDRPVIYNKSDGNVKKGFHACFMKFICKHCWAVA